DDALERAVRRHHDDRGVLRVHLELMQELDPENVGKLDVEQNDIGRELRENAHAVTACACGPDLPLVAEECFEAGNDARLVIDDENAVAKFGAHCEKSYACPYFKHRTF